MQLDDVQKLSLDDVIKKLHASISELVGLAKDAQRRTEKPRRQTTQPSPQVGFLNNALTATIRMAERTNDPRVFGSCKVTGAIGQYEGRSEGHRNP